MFRWLAEAELDPEFLLLEHEGIETNPHGKDADSDNDRRAAEFPAHFGNERPRDPDQGGTNEAFSEISPVASRLSKLALKKGEQQEDPKRDDPGKSRGGSEFGGEMVHHRAWRGVALPNRTAARNGFTRALSQRQYLGLGAEIKGHARLINRLHFRIGDSVTDKNSLRVDDSRGAGGPIEDSLKLEACGRRKFTG